MSRFDTGGNRLTIKVPCEAISDSMGLRVEIDANWYEDLLRFRNANQVSR